MRSLLLCLLFSVLLGTLAGCSLRDGPSEEELASLRAAVELWEGRVVEGQALLATALEEVEHYRALVETVGGEQATALLAQAERHAETAATWLERYQTASTVSTAALESAEAAGGGWRGVIVGLLTGAASLAIPLGGKLALLGRALQVTVGTAEAFKVAGDAAATVSDPAIGARVMEDARNAVRADQTAAGVRDFLMAKRKQVAADSKRDPREPDRRGYP